MSARLRSRRRAVPGDGFLQIAELFTRQQADITQSGEVLFRAGEIADHQIGLADVLMCAEMAWVELDRALVQGFGDLEIAPAPLDLRQPVLREDHLIDRTRRRAGLRADLFTLEDIAAVPFVGEILADSDREHSGLESARRAHELVRRIITRMIEDVIAECGRRVAMLKPRSAVDVREAPRPVVGFSPAMDKADRDIKGFLYPRMYRHDRVMRVMDDAEGVVRDLFGHYSATPADLPEEWREGMGTNDSDKTRRIADYIAGMTDRYALVEHAKYFKQTPELR